jgi:hypothetical protein
MYFDNFYKDISTKKRVQLQQFGIIHLSNSDLTYINNPERETELRLRPSAFWKLTSRTLLCYLFLFHPLTQRETSMATGVERPQYAKLLLILSCFCWKQIFFILPKIDGCQVETANCWSCGTKGDSKVAYEPWQIQSLSRQTASLTFRISWYYRILRLSIARPERCS